MIMVRGFSERDSVESLGIDVGVWRGDVVLAFSFVWVVDLVKVCCWICIVV